MKKLLVVTLVGLLFGWGLAGCGSDSGFEAIIVVKTDDVTFSGETAEGTPLATAGPVLMVVQKSSSDTTPVPDVNITLDAGGVNSSVLICFVPWAAGPVCTSPPPSIPFPFGGTSFVKTRTDENGAIRVYPLITLILCPVAPTADLGGSGTVSAFISTDLRAWDATFTIDCV